MEETGTNKLRLRNRQILCRYGVGPREADAVSNLESAGWSADEITALLDGAIIENMLKPSFFGGSLGKAAA